jgi:hypothetical protein
MDLESQVAGEGKESIIDVQGEPDVEVVAAEGVAEESEPSYEPNYHFKVRDEERSFDEWMQPFIKDSETESRVRELYEKAHGLEYVKNDRQYLRDQLQQTSDELGQFNTVKEELARVGQYIKSNDLESFFQQFNLSDEQIYQYAVNKLQMQENPEQKAAYDQQRETQARQWDLESQNRNYQTQLENLAVQQRSFELDSVLNRPEVSTVAQDFDARMGRQGAFRDEIINRGQLYFHTTGQDVSAERVVTDVMNLLGSTPGQQAQVATPQQGAAAHQAKPPVIPNIRGQGTSPVKKIPRSIADLRQLGQSMQ